MAERENDLLRELRALSERTKAISEALAASRTETVATPVFPPTYGAYARAIVKNRDKLRQQLPTFFVCDPGFDILLELFAAKEEGKSLSVSSVCYAAGCPPTTALRWIKSLEMEGLIERRSDPHDGRRVFLELKTDTYDLVYSWLAKISSLPLNWR